MASLAVLPAASWACIAASAIGAPSVTMLVIHGSCASFDWIVCCTDGRSAPLTCRFSVFGKPYFTPWQRVSSATEPWAWMMHSVLPLASSAASFCPTVCPASSSSEPKYILAPASL